MDNYIGRLLDNRYEILEVIGTGGMAVVYKALCHRLNRLVAIKILKDEFSRDQEFRRRFHAESQAVAMLSHPNIVSVYDVSRSGDVDYIVMELIEGITLKQYLEKKGRLNWRETLHFSMQIAKALEHAHSRGIVHRDIKPHNIMILKDGSIKVADFGIARIGSAQNTLTREALGSVHYISPEQAKGGHVDSRSDLYSLGVVMYEMLTGRTPYDGETPVSVAIQHINGGATPPGELVDGIPRGIEQITMHAMEVNPDARYASATEMLHDMEEFRKNPGITFLYFGGNAPEMAPPLRTPRPAAPRSEAERYAAARRTADRSPDERRAERERREAEQAAEKKRRLKLIGILSGAGVAVILLIVLLISLLGGSKDPTNPVDTVSVPNFVGMQIDAINPDDYPELNIDIAGATYEYNENYPKGQVYDQSPKANDQVKGGKTRTVTLKVSLGEETNKMPYFVNQTETSALAQLNAMNLGLKITTKEESSDTIVAGYVIRTEPAANTELTKEQAVTIYISLGSTKMPELKLQTKANAEALLKAMGLNLKTTFLEEESDDVAEGSVTRTEPASGSELSKGQVVTVYISKGNGKLKVPPVEGLDVMDAIKLLREAGLTYDIKRVFSETEEKDRVIRQSEKANTQVAKDTVVTLEVSDGPAPTNPPTEPTQPTTEPTQPTPPEEPVG